ncbi:hypothetical protein [Pseudochelatococcus contaminans]|uniref:Regulator of replication initiation timing n=1 Tax=Pseudochelatococcus contaminans TaxID=1538103 RepID=A0A7W5Z2I4_9HYPH|nr:hypothetical protein [Pseudochelatococcus contaminans]MBB3808799.1 regulator of replication initiation timing [Pseudochelatococcus contaminans]
MGWGILDFIFGPSGDIQQKLRLIEGRVYSLKAENTRLAAECHELRRQLNEARAAITAASDALLQVDTSPITEAGNDHL